MRRDGGWRTLVGVVGVLGLVVTVAWAQTAAPPKAKLERLRIAVAPLGYDTNFSWMQTLSGQLDKRPALEYLVGIDRNTGAYIPELAEKWEMAPDGMTLDHYVTQGRQIPRELGRIHRQGRAPCGLPHHPA